jgi:hypothetical protein
MGAVNNWWDSVRPHPAVEPRVHSGTGGSERHPASLIEGCGGTMWDKSGGEARRSGQGYSVTGRAIPLAKGRQMLVGGAGIVCCIGAMRLPVPALVPR